MFKNNRREQLNNSLASSVSPLDRPSTPAPTGQRAGRTRDMSSFELDIERIRVDNNQVRKSGKAADDPEIIELSASIKEHGVLQALQVRYVGAGDYYQLVAGERRYVAAKLAKLNRVPVKLLDVDDRAAREIQVIENIQRADLQPVELGVRLHEMMNEGATLATLEKKLHKSQPWISKVVAIAKKFSAEAKAIAGTTSVAHLYEVSQIPPEQQAPMIEQIQRRGLTVEQLKDVIAETKEQHRGNRGRPSKKRSKRYEQCFRATHGLTITVKARRGSVSDAEVADAFRVIAESLDAQSERKAA